MNDFYKYLLSGPLPKIYFLPKPLNFVGCQGNQKAKFAKSIKKINSSEAIWGIKLKLCRNDDSIRFYKILFLLPLHMHSGCYGNLGFP